MTNPNNAQDLIGRTAVASDGDKIGKIGQVYVDDETGQPRWVTVSTGLFGNKESFAPLAGAQQAGDDIQLAVTKDIVKDAPNIDDDGHLNDDENDALYDYYAGHGIGSARRTAGDVGQTDDTGARSDVDTGARSDVDTGARSDVDTDRGQDVSGPNTDEAMTRSEERLHVGTESVETGRARLRKFVVTENVTQTVPVSHEEVRVVREPITEDNRDAATSGAEISEEEHEVTLHAERPVVEKETVPVERVSLGTETVMEEQTVNEQVRSEQIETDGARDDR